VTSVYAANEKCNKAVSIPISDIGLFILAIDFQVFNQIILAAFLSLNTFFVSR
jgi:hypothetical protein